MTKVLKEYVMPEVEVMEFRADYVLCVSDPKNSGLEGLDYENW